MAVTKKQQEMIRNWGLIKLAQERLARCQDRSDWIGVAYNERLIAKYQAMLKATPVPKPPSIPGVV